MSIWLRLIMTIIKYVFSSKPGKLETEYTLRFKVLPHEADLKYVNNARYLTFMECARLDMMLRSGLLIQCIKNKWTPLVAAQSIRIAKPLKRLDSFTLKSKVLMIGKSSVYIKHLFYRDQEVVAKAIVRTVVVAKEGKVPVETMLSKVGGFLDIEKNEDFFRKWKEMEEYLH